MIEKTFLATLLANYYLDDRESAHVSPAWGISWLNIYGSGRLHQADKVLTGEGCDETDDHFQFTKWSQLSKTFAESMEQVCYSRRFATTKNCTMGLATPRAQKGDLVVFLAGGLHPFVLRQKPDSTFMLVGDCYLHGLDRRHVFAEDAGPAEEYVLS